ncbi:MAG: IgGFc-binding protein [Bacteroidales bacterium]|nr:IgGFc-binding protein [Bacteroidales bacterium]
MKLNSNIMAALIGLTWYSCSVETITAPESIEEAALNIALTKAATPEDEIADARLIVTNTAGTNIIFNQKLSDALDSDHVNFQTTLKVGTYNIYLFANELSSWNLDNVANAGSIRDKVLTAAPGLTVDVSHLIPMYRAWEGVQLHANGATTVDGIALDLTSDLATGGGKVERLYSKVEVVGITCNYSDLNNIPIALDSLQIMHLPASEYTGARPYTGTAFYNSNVLKTVSSNYTQTASGFTFNGTASPFFVPEHIITDKSNASYLLIYCHLIADPSTKFTYRLYLGDGLKNGFMPDPAVKTLKELSITRNTYYKLTVSQIKGFGTMELGTVYVEVQPWAPINVNTNFTENVLNLSSIKASYSECQLDDSQPWIIHWETNNDPQYILYEYYCANSLPGSGLALGLRDTVNAGSCDQWVTVLSPTMIYAADGMNFTDTLQILDWFQVEMSADGGVQNTQGYYKGRIKLIPYSNTQTPTPWPSTGKYHIYAGDAGIRRRELEIEMTACAFNPLVPGGIYYNGVCSRIVTKVEEDGPYAEILGDLPEGGDNSYTYQWEYSLDDYTWTPVPSGGASQNYIPASEIEYGIKYRRKVTDGQGNFGYSNSVQIFIVNLTTTPEVETSSNKGRDFWLSFGNIFNNQFTSNALGLASTDYPVLTLEIVADQVTSVNLAFNANPAVNQTYTVPAGVTKINLTKAQYLASYIAPKATGFDGADSTYNSTCVLVPHISQNSLHVISDHNIILYVFEGLYGFSESSVIHPTPTLGRNYFQVGYKSWEYYTLHLADGFLVVAPTACTLNMTKHDGTVLPPVSLAAGQVYAYYGDIAASTGGFSEDLSGMHVTSTQPVAFFTSNNCATVPDDVNAMNILYEELESVEKWGKRFFVPQTAQGMVRIRIMASEAATTIVPAGVYTIPANGGGTLSLSLPLPGDFVELECTDAAGVYIESDKPVMVVYYMVGNGNTALDGAPAMGWIPAIEQNLKSARVAPFWVISYVPGTSTLLPWEHYALVVTKTAWADSTTISIDGSTPVSLTGTGITWYSNATAGLSFCSVQFTQDEYYEFYNPDGLVVSGYGKGGYYECYNFLGAASFRDLRATMQVNGVLSDMMAGNTYGDCDPITFDCIYTDAPSAIVWRINGVEQTAHANQSSWSATLPVSDYIIEMEATIGTETFTQITWLRVRCCTDD